MCIALGIKIFAHYICASKSHKFLTKPTKCKPCRRRALSRSYRKACKPPQHVSSARTSPTQCSCTLMYSSRTLPRQKFDHNTPKRSSRMWRAHIRLGTARRTRHSLSASVTPALDYLKIVCAGRPSHTLCNWTAHTALARGSCSTLRLDALALAQAAEPNRRHRDIGQRSTPAK